MNDKVSNIVNITKIIAIACLGLACDVLMDRINDQFDKDSKVPTIINSAIFSGIMCIGSKTLYDLYTGK
jgi:hypothetical protein